MTSNPEPSERSHPPAVALEKYPGAPATVAPAVSAATTRRQLLLIWLVTSVLAVLACSVNLSAAKLNGEYVPVGNDSVYHARRILDTARDPGSFYEFDKKIHAPEGSLLTWPWGYDYALGWMVRVGVKLGISDDPMAILDWIPVAAAPISIALLLLVAVRIGLSPWLVTLSGLCFGLVPTFQLLHSVGDIDHHYAEMMFHLAALAAGLAWLRRIELPRAAALTAVILGIAPAIHNGLFILQIPLLLVLTIFWLQNRSLPQRALMVFCIVLVGSTLAICIPSLPFRLGRFEFYTLSWFHLYIAICTAVVVVALAKLKVGNRGFWTLGAVCFALALPILHQLNTAHTFLTGANPYLEAIGEMQSPFHLAEKVGSSAVTNVYSYLVYLVPFTIALCLIYAWRERMQPRLLFWVTAAGGLTMLSLQLRMHYFGDFALCMPWLAAAQEFVHRRPDTKKKILLLVTLASILLYQPALRQSVRAMPRSNDLSFDNIRPIFTSLQKACAKEPGIVLADNNAGHYIRYYTECSVIANNFLLTPQHFAKAAEVERLFNVRAYELAKRAPTVKYVLVRPLDMKAREDGTVGYKFFFPGNNQLARDLLLSPVDTAPANFQLLDEIRFKDVGNAPYARLFKVTTDAGNPHTSSQNQGEM